MDSHRSVNSAGIGRLVSGTTGKPDDLAVFGAGVRDRRHGFGLGAVPGGAGG